MPPYKRIIVICLIVIIILIGGIIGFNIIRMVDDKDPPSLLSVSYDSNPKINSSITISIFVDDVSGIKSCTFYYRENGNEWQSIEMRRYVILCCPPRYLVRLGPFQDVGLQVNFYFVIIDTKDNIYESDIYTFTVTEMGA